ncbi:MAG: FMN-binding protein [Eubacteriales bacterium]|nr:FMN-binding protein [Eubacteriales bacterium]
MKLFLTRIINLLLIAVVLLVYQQQATARVRAVEDCEEQNSAVMNSKAGPAAALFTNTHEESSSGSYQDGNYRGTGFGFSGDLTVEVTVEDEKITDVSIVDSVDDAEYLNKASALLDEIVENQGVDDIDVVSGATFSSNGILDAFRDAMGE